VNRWGPLIAVVACLSGCLPQSLDGGPRRGTGGSGAGKWVGLSGTGGRALGDGGRALGGGGRALGGGGGAGGHGEAGSPDASSPADAARSPDAASSPDGAPADGGSIDSGPSRSVNASINAAHDGTQPNDVIASPLTKRWSLTIQGGVYSYPVIADGRLFLSYADGQSRLAAYALEDGQLLWGPIGLASTVLLTYDGGVLVGLDRTGALSGWDAATGRSLWSEPLPTQWVFDAAPVASNGLIYVNGLGSGGTIYAVEPATGRLRWSAQYYGGEGAVAVGDGTIYQVSGCALVSALNALTGQVSVIHQTSCTGGGGGMPVYADGRLWVTDTVQGSVIINRAGTVLGSFGGGLPAVHNGTAFYGGDSATAVDVATGAQKWATPIDRLCMPLVVAGGGGQVFGGTVSGVLYELDEATGAQISSDTTSGSGATCWSPAIAQGRLAFVSGGSVAVY
jgi:hypothetical protein